MYMTCREDAVVFDKVFKATHIPLVQSQTKSNISDPKGGFLLQFCHSIFADSVLFKIDFLKIATFLL